MKIFKSLAVAGAMMAATASAAEEQFITIGTGGQTGVYFVVGQSICRLVNRGTAEHNLKCTAPSTGGSIANINAIMAGDMDMGVAQSDWQFHAYNGTSEFEGNKFDRIARLRISLVMTSGFAVVCSTTKKTSWSCISTSSVVSRPATTRRSLPPL